MNDYGERVAPFAPTFRLDMLDHRDHGPWGEVHFRLSIGEQVIGYTSTPDLDISPQQVTERIFEERAKTAAAWESDPGAIVRRVKWSRSVEAMFKHPQQAEEFIAAQRDPDGWRMETMEGRRIVGTTGHGHAILEALDRAEGK